MSETLDAGFRRVRFFPSRLVLRTISLIDERHTYPHRVLDGSGSPTGPADDLIRKPEPLLESDEAHESRAGPLPTPDSRLSRRLDPTAVAARRQV